MFFDIPSTDAPGCLIPRTIPLMRYEDRQFEKIVCFRDPDSIRTSVNEIMKMQALGAGMSMEAATAAATKEIGTIAVLDGQEEQLEKWNGMLAGKSGVTIPAHTTQIVEISAGAEEASLHPRNSSKGSKTAKKHNFLIKNSMLSPQNENLRTGYPFSIPKLRRMQYAVYDRKA